MTIAELKTLAQKKKQSGYTWEALDLYKQLWHLEKNEWNGYFLAQLYRKTQNFSEARKLHEDLEKTYPNFKPLKNDKLWLDYNEKIKEWENPDLLSDAEDLLLRADKYDKYTSSVYTKTVLNVVRYLCMRNEYIEAYHWLLKLDQSVISNSTFNFKDQIFPADRKVYFIRYADVLVQLDEYFNYIEKCLKTLEFKTEKRLEFQKFIKEDITFNDYISRVKLAKHIKGFQEEFYLRIKKITNKIYESQKTTLVSDLSHYLFCPVSFAINETFQIEANTSWEKDEWLGEKKIFSDRHKIFKATKSFEDTFKDSEITIDLDLQTDFDYLFSSTIRVNNSTNIKPIIYSNKAGDLIGAPEYLMEDSLGYKFTITEKFSSIHSADSSTPFESDLVKHYAFINEFESVDIKFGYLITWYWQLIDIQTDNGIIKKKIVITSYRLTKIENNRENLNKLNRAINAINKFKKAKIIEIDGDRISYPNKCLNCSVVSYCNHKTGKFNNIELPYDLDILTVDSEPKLEF